jgi:hypothetical protein
MVDDIEIGQVSLLCYLLLPILLIPWLKDHACRTGCYHSVANNQLCLLDWRRNWPCRGTSLDWFYQWRRCWKVGRNWVCLRFPNFWPMSSFLCQGIYVCPRHWSSQNFWKQTVHQYDPSQGVKWSTRVVFPYTGIHRSYAYGWTRSSRSTLYSFLHIADIAR